MTFSRLALRAKASNRPYICTPGRPKIVSMPWRSRESTMASPPVMRGMGDPLIVALPILARSVAVAAGQAPHVEIGHSNDELLRCANGRRKPADDQTATPGRRLRFPQRAGVRRQPS